ncbi:AraC family transcriptional regulator [Ideonella sp.]|uniref:AraC family transcriptional regulator n=1 Tax=Ideonella sp. TaxID=1929293 RepID=UPI0035B4448E
MHLLTFRRLGASALLATAWLAAACLGVPAAAQAQPAAVPPAPAASATAPAAAAASAPAPAASGAALDQRVQDLKSEVINLNRDLLVLEEELLYPASTQVAVFVSMDVGKLFSLESVEIKFDEKTVAHYLYTPAEVAALHRGGVQRLYVGNLRAGAHEITAFFTGQGPHTRDYKRATTLKFDKGGEPKYIELQIKDATANLQPQFEVKVW